LSYPSDKIVLPIPVTKPVTKLNTTTTNAPLNEVEAECVTSSNSKLFETLKQNEFEILKNSYEDSERQKKISKFREDSLNDDKCNAVFRERFATTDVTLEQLYDDCCDYWSQKNQMVFKSRFLTHLNKCPVSNYPEKGAIGKSQKQIEKKKQQEIKRQLETSWRIVEKNKPAQRALDCLSELKASLGVINTPLNEI
jgi:hypothetical protein